MLGRLRALDGAQGWKTKDADIQTYVATVMTAIQSGKLSRETVPTTIERVILTLTALGLDATDFCGQDLTAWLYENQNWNNYVSSDLIWGLIALDSGKYTAADGYREALIQHLTEYQKQDTGAFFYSHGYNADDVDMTAMAMIALAPYKDSNAVGSTSNPTVTTRATMAARATTPAAPTPMWSSPSVPPVRPVWRTPCPGC